MKVIYTGHLKFRIKVRQISLQLPKTIVKTAIEHYFDNQTNHYVAVKRANYAGKIRWMAVTYDKISSDKIEGAATDSFRLAERNVLRKTGIAEQSVIIPRSTVLELVRIFSNYEGA